jgi:glutamate-1-semialdehyde 2,1-aminomutase
LSASLLSLAALKATLGEIMTPANHAAMETGAARLAADLEAVIATCRLPWTVSRLGARMELQFSARAPRDAAQARAAMQPALEAALHLYMLNRGLVLTPFHNMLLVSPVTGEADLQRVPAVLQAFVEEAGLG